MSTDIRPHPAAALFPLLSDDEMSELVDDVKKRGLRDPIVVIEEDGQRLILDGRNRERACELANVEPRYKVFTGGDPVAYIISANLRRRHLSVTQRARIGEKLEPIYAAEAKKRQREAGTEYGKGHPKVVEDLPQPKKRSNEPKARDQAAKVLGISGRTISKAKRLTKDGAPEVNALLDEDLVTFDDAESVVTFSKEEQAKLAEDVRGGKARTLLQASMERDLKRSAVVSKTKLQAARRSRDEHKNELVCRLRDEGKSVKEIVQETGFAQSFVRKFCPITERTKRRKDVVRNAVADIEGIAETWESLATNLPQEWEPGRRQIIDALNAARLAAKRLIRKLSNA